MPIYKAFGAYIESDVPLLDLKPCSGKASSYFFCKHPPFNQTADQTEGAEWFDSWTDGDGQIWALLGQQDSRYLIRFPGLADFRISSDGRETVCVPCLGVPAETTDHLFLDQVFPCLLSRRNQLMLHAAAVVVDGGGIVFIGETGAGKSTMASGFGQAGFQLLADDGLLVVEDGERFTGIPSYPSLRLWQESLRELFTNQTLSTDVAHYSSKQRVSAEHGEFSFASAPVPLRCIYLLRPQPVSEEKNDQHMDVLITHVSPQKAFNECFSGIFRLDFRNRDLVKEQFVMAARLVDTTPVFALSFPHDFSLLPSVRATIVTHLR